jgi:ankyrin repeat protein
VYKRQPLHVAAQRGHIGVVAFLMQRGANTYAADKYLQRPISHAVMFSRMLCVKALLPNADLTHADAHGMTLLHQAVSYGAGPEVLEAILPRYVAEGLLDMPTAKAQDSDKLACMTALMIACELANCAHVQLLLQAGASRHVQDSQGAHPLIHCIAGKSIECLQLLLALDDVQNRHFTPQQLTCPSHTHSPLVCAVHAGRADMVQLLIAAGADPSGTFQAGTQHVTFHGLARKWWPDNKDLAALFTPGFAPGSAP